jgi:MerR family transcriptional regulator/heat shock protein HspR
LGVNIAGIAIILQMRERMEEMNRQMQSFVEYVRSEMLSHFQQATPSSLGAIVPLRKATSMKPTVVAKSTAKRKSKGAYMISAVAEMYEIHPQTLRLYEREGLLKPSRTEGNTRLYTDEDLERLEFILNLARDLGVNIAGIAIILQMRERMEEMNRQMQSFVEYVRTEMLARFSQAAPGAGAMVPLRKQAAVTKTPATSRKA